MRNKKNIFSLSFIGFIVVLFFCQYAFGRDLESSSSPNFKTDSGYKSTPQPTPSYNSNRSYTPPSHGNVRPQIIPVSMSPQDSQGTFQPDGRGGFQPTAPGGRTAAGSNDTQWRGYKGAKVTEVSKSEYEMMGKKLAAQGMQLVPLQGKTNEYALYNTKTRQYLQGEYFRVHGGESIITHLDMPATQENIKGLIGGVGGQLAAMAKAQGKEATYLGVLKSSEAFDEAVGKNPNKTNAGVGIMWGVVQEAPNAFRVIRWEREGDTNFGLRSQIYYRLKPLE